MPPALPRSDMGSASATLSPQESLAGLVSVIDKQGPADNGHCYDFQGNSIPW
jgi:hypothetical protein